jgi:hypothetical protein
MTTKVPPARSLALGTTLEPGDSCDSQSGRDRRGPELLQGQQAAHWRATCQTPQEDRQQTNCTQERDSHKAALGPSKGLSRA